MIQAQAITNGEPCAGVSPAQVETLLADEKSVLWLDVSQPSQEELAWLGKVFGFHPLALEDCAHYSNLPKLDEFPDHVFMVFHSISYDPQTDELERPELDAFLGQRYLVTVHQEPIGALSAVWDKCRHPHGPLARSPDFTLHAVLDAVVDQYMPILDHWDEALEAVEDRILAGNTGKAVLDDILTIKRHILELRRSLGPQREVIGRLARRDFPFVSERAIIYFRDIQDHVVRLYELLEMQRDLLSGAMDAYRSTLSNRMNQVMQRLTALSTIFLPLTFIAGVYGMNFNPQASPWNMPELSWPWGYPLILGFMAGLAGVMFIYMWRHRWL